MRNRSSVQEAYQLNLRGDLQLPQSDPLICSSRYRHFSASLSLYKFICVLLLLGLWDSFSFFKFSNWVFRFQINIWAFEKTLISSNDNVVFAFTHSSQMCLFFAPFSFFFSNSFALCLLSLYTLLFKNTQ